MAIYSISFLKIANIYIWKELISGKVGVYYMDTTHGRVEVSCHKDGIAGTKRKN